MRRVAQLMVVAVGMAAAAVPAAGQGVAREIRYSAADALSGFPDDVHLGEVAGVARTARGEIYVYTRTGNPAVTLGTSRYVALASSRVFKFDPSGRFEREIGQGIYGALYAQQVRVSPDGDVWIVDRMSGQVIRFDSQGRIRMVLSRKPETLRVPAPDAGPSTRPAAEGESFRGPTDIAWDSEGNIYVADGIENSRIAKYDPSGRWITNLAGTRGSGPGEFDVIHGLQIDDQDNLYVADLNNRRIQVLDTNGRVIREMSGFGAPMAICITPGPDQVLYVSNSNPPDDLEVGGEIYKVGLDGTIHGRFGRVGKRIGMFGTVNAIDCREENDLLVGEVGNWRVQRVYLHPTD